MFWKILQIIVPFIWFGLVGGISFLEAPLKFQAPHITIPLGLGIGRLVFFWLNKIEIVLMILMIFSLVRAKPNNRFAVRAFAFVCAILILETVWLLPALDARATLVISGEVEPFSSLHLVYIVCDALKLILLFALGTSILKSRLKFD